MPTYNSATTNYYTLTLTCSESQVDTDNNRSKISYTLTLKTGSTWFDTIRVGYTIKINGTTVATLNYTNATPKSMSRNSSWDIYSSTCWVNHDADGKKTIAAGQISASLNTQTGNVVPNLSLSSGSAWTLTNIPRASTISISGSTTLGSARTITISAASNTFKHTLTYEFGSATGTIATKTSSTSVSWTPAKSLSAQIASGNSSKTGTVTCKTYNGDTLVGTTTASFTGVIPASGVSTSANSNLMGTVRKITIDRASSNLTHKITYSYGSASGTIASSAATSADWTVPTSLAAQVASGSTHQNGTIDCETFNGTKSCGTTSVTFRADIPASTITAPSGVWTIGNTQTLTISRVSSNLTHTLTYSFGSTSGASIDSGVGTSKSWQLPANMVRQVPSGSIQLAGTIKCETFNGTASVGSVTINFTAKIPASTLAVNNTTVTLGNSRTFTITPKDSGATNIKHVLTYTCGSTTGTIKNPATTSESWTAPKSLAAQAATNTTSVSIVVTATTYNGTALVGTNTVTLTGNIPASTIGAHTFTIGTSGTVTVNRASNNLAHMVYYTFYNETNQQAVAKTTATTLTWTPKMSLCNQLPNATSGTGTIYVATYNGNTQIGTAQSGTLTLKVPASVVPTDLSISTVIQNSNATIAGWGIAVAGYSKVRSTVSANGAYSATISSRQVTFGSQSGNAALSGGNYVWESSKLSESGSITPSLKVTDSRGRTATKNGTAITVYAYSVPKVTTATVYRSDSSGNKDRQGAYATVNLAGSVTSLGSRNTATLRARYKPLTGGSWSAYTTLTNNTPKTINWSLSYLIGYQVELSITDSLGNTTTRQITIPADMVTMHLRLGGKGIGFGTYSQGDNRIDYNAEWDIYTGRIFGLGSVQEIANGSDLNSAAFRIPGRYAVSMNSIAGSLSNCPSTKAGVLTVYASSGQLSANPETQTYAYIIQEYTTYQGTFKYQRHIYSGATAGSWTFGNWVTTWASAAEDIILTYYTNNYVSSNQFSNFYAKRNNSVCVLSWSFVAKDVYTATFEKIGTFDVKYAAPITMYQTCYDSSIGGNTFCVIRVYGNEIQIKHHFSSEGTFAGSLTWVI